MSVLTPQQTTTLRNWIGEQLDRLLGFSSDDVIDTLLANVTESEFDRFANELLGSETTAVRFIHRLKDRRNEFSTLRFARDVKIAQSKDVTVYRKSEQSNVKFLAPAIKKSKKQMSQQNQQQEQREIDRIEAAEAQQVADEAELEEKRKIRHPGSRCECQATRHKLVINCSSCGRIICEREAGDYCLFCGFWLNNKYDGPLTEDERRAEIHKQKLLLFDRDSERRTRVFDDQADYFSTETEAWLDPAELAARRKLRAEAEAARQRQRSTLTLTFDFAGRQVVSHAGDADRAVLDKRFGVAEQPQSQGDAEMEKRLAAELDAVERIKLLSINDKEKTAASSVITTTTTIAAKSQSNEPDISLSTEPIAPLRIKPSDNIEMRPIALAREHDDSQATSGATKKKNDKKKKKKNENKQKKNNAEKSKHEKVQSAHDELF